MDSNGDWEAVLKPQICSLAQGLATQLFSMTGAIFMNGSAVGLRKGDKASRKPRPVLGGLLFPDLKAQAAPSCWAILLLSPGSLLLLPCPTGGRGRGEEIPYRHSLKVIVDIHPAILGDADEEGIQSNLHVLEMPGQKCTKESDPKHGKHLPERPKKMPELYPTTLETGQAAAMQSCQGNPGVQAQRPLLFSIHPLPPVPSDLGALVREREQLGVGEGTDQHEEKDEGHDVGHVRHRLQDDTDDPGQRLHRHAHMYQTKCPMAQPLRGAPRPLPCPSAPLTLNLPRGAETIPTPFLSRDPDRCPSFPQSSQLT